MATQENSEDTESLTPDSNVYVMNKLSEFVKEFGWQDYTIIVKFRGKRISRGAALRQFTFEKKDDAKELTE